ncbi:MAG: Alanine racemase, catabolic [Rhodocyclaceae bacterium]|nr:MAG: alanine racemase [Rhodocyclaceae bacterium]MBE7421918.1 alanine racemase [Zoogloeaceae bacterium]MBV6407981.1 Alanine racemase, catabolic [Rhodocyclaceae bacterium]MCK6384325.1 alanine racemase [Rhodocyclaceae bacterium]CAG0929049.1 alanine racemase [Rhodocyclaceae bacterium]
MTRPIRATIDLSALRGNLAVARQHAGAARLWAVLKADAYGHGLMRVAGALDDLADGFALLDIEDAIALREAGFRQPILLLEGFFEADELPLLAEYGLTPVVHSLEQVDMLTSAALPARLQVYLKLNTGMNRLGLSAEEFHPGLTALETTHNVSGITLMTHFADADLDRGIDWQMARFEEAVQGCEHPVSLANSAALLRFAATRRGWARPGIMLYGSSPYPQDESAEALGLRAVMTLSSQLISVQELAAGERVGYGGIFTAERPMRIGIVACGYADGYPRHAPVGTPVLVEGRRTRTVGRVSMDMIMVDLEGIPAAGIGSPVVLWGEGLPVDDVATAAGTVGYELLCALAPRVPVTEKE